MKPYAKAQTIPLTEKTDRRRVLTEKQKQEIREIYAKGELGTRRIAALFGCSRSLVQLVINPEIAERNKARFKAHWRDYHNARGQAYYTRAIRNWRNYKYALYKTAQGVQEREDANPAQIEGEPDASAQKGAERASA